MGLTPTEAWGLAAWSLPFLGLVVLAWKRGGIVAVSGLGIVFAAVGWIAYWLLAEGPPRYAFVGVLPIFLATLGALTLAGISYNRLERPSGLRFVHRGGLLVGLAVTPGLWLAGSASERFSVVEYVLVCVMTMLATDLVVVACSSGQRARWAAAIAAFLYVTALAFGTRGEAIFGGTLSFGLRSAGVIDAALPGEPPVRCRLMLDGRPPTRDAGGGGWVIAHAGGVHRLAYSLGARGDSVRDLRSTTTDTRDPAFLVVLDTRAVDSRERDAASPGWIHLGAHEAALLQVGVSREPRLALGPMDSLTWLAQPVRVLLPLSRARAISGPPGLVR